MQLRTTSSSVFPSKSASANSEAKKAYKSAVLRSFTTLEHGRATAGTQASSAAFPTQISALALRHFATADHILTRCDSIRLDAR